MCSPTWIILWTLLCSALARPSFVPSVIYNVNAGYSKSEIQLRNDGVISSTYSLVQHDRNPNIELNPVIYKEVPAVPVSYTVPSSGALFSNQPNPLNALLKNTPSQIQLPVTRQESDFRNRINTISEELPPGYVPLVKKIEPPPGYQIVMN